MKWYFSINANTMNVAEMGWPGMLRVAVKSAIRNTDLQPFLLWDGPESEVSDEMRQLGVEVIPHRVAFYGALRRHAGTGDGSQHYLNVASGAFLRFDIPLIEREDEYVLYTDVDVVFRKRLDFGAHTRPRLFSAAPQFTQDYEDMNSGIMLLNVPAMRECYHDLVEFTRENLSLGLDQEVMRVFFKDQYDPMDLTLNWKPYWGFNPDAQIVHWHGPKPALVRRFIEKPEETASSPIRYVFEKDPVGYSAFLDEWESYPQLSPVVVHVDGFDSERVWGWAINREQPDNPVSLNLLADGCPVGSARCHRPRPDVLAAGYGSASVGFDARFPGELRPGCRLSVMDWMNRPVELHFRTGLGPHLSQQAA